MTEAFLERAVVELVYKYDEKSTMSVELTAKVPFKLFGVIYYIHINEH